MKSWCFGYFLVLAIAHLLLASPAAASTTHTRHSTDCAGISWVPQFLRISWLRDTLADFVFHRDRSNTNDARRARQWHEAAHSPRYATQTVIRFNVMTADEETALAEAAQRLFLDIWSFNNNNGTVDILLDKDDIASLLTLLPNSLHHSFTPLVPDLAAAVRDTYPTSAASTAALFSTKPGSTPNDAFVSGGGGTDNIFFRDYQPYPVIVQWMKLLDVMFPFVDMITVGETAEGREIVGLRIGASKSDGVANKESEDPVENADKDEIEGDVDAIKKEKLHKGKKDKKTKKPRKSEPEDPGPDGKRKTILITGGLHAREWISSSSVSYVAWAIITGYGNTNMITKLVDSFDIVVVPVVNPDGYEYTWQTDRLWRKTRQTTNFRFCRGYDLDHAFGYEWDSKARDEPCSETYGGESAFQAVEARTISAWAHNLIEEGNTEFIGFLDLHSYSQQIMFPFSYSCATDPPNLENLEELAAGLAKAIRLSTGETYSITSACEGVLGSTSAADTGEGADSSKGSRGDGTRIESGGGSAIDWFYHDLKAKYSYQIKLRDTGSYGFLLPSSEIVPTGEEVFSAVKYFGDFLLGNNGIEKSKAVEGSSSADAKHDEATQPRIHISDEADGDAEQVAIQFRQRRRR